MSVGDWFLWTVDYDGPVDLLLLLLLRLLLRLRLLICFSNTSHLFVCMCEHACAAEGNYMLHDVDGENQMDFCLSVSLRRRSVRTRPLLHGLTVYCSPNVEPPVSGMRTVVECAGGQVKSPLSTRCALCIACLLHTSHPLW